jgi:hypothetical protein
MTGAEVAYIAVVIFAFVTFGIFVARANNASMRYRQTH